MRANPLEDGTLSAYRVHRVPMSTLTTRAVEAIEGVTTRDAGRAKNLFALGVISWLYGRPTDVTKRWIERKFARDPAVAQANLAAFNAGWSFGETTELLDVQYHVNAATDVPPGTYRNVNGTTALSLGLIAASVRSGLPLVLASYPITPASELLHELSKHASIGVSTIQAEDEIAAAGMALGASFGGKLGVTATSGPGMDLKAEMIGLAVMLELPLVVIDVQRAGPSTGMPTKTEQSDLLLALHGRHGESPLPVIAPSTAGGCFAAAFEAAAIAIRYRTPVILLSDSFLASSSEPWLVPDVATLPAIDPAFATAPDTTTSRLRPTAVTRSSPVRGRSPGTPGLPAPDRRPGEGRRQRQHLLRRRQPRADDRAARGQGGDGRRRDPAAGRRLPSPNANLLVLGWGSTEGSIRAGVRLAREAGYKVACAQLRHLNPLPANTGDVLRSFERVLVPELNSGQLASVLRSRFLVDVESYTKVRASRCSPARSSNRSKQRQ